MGQHCGKCYRVCLEDWTYCPFCGAQERYGMPMRCKPVPRFSDETTCGWVVEERRADGVWVRSAQGHVWESNADAHRQRDELQRRYPERLYGVAPWRQLSEKA